MNPRHAITALVATLGLASSAALLAASPTTPDAQQQPWAGKHHGPGPGGHMHGGGMDFGFMHALHQLNLSDAQRQSVKSILDGNRDQMRSFHESMRSNHEALATLSPDDPNYANAVATAKDLSAQAVQHASDLRVQLYAVLNADQKKELPGILAKQQADMKARREQWMSHRQQPQSAT